MRILRSFLSLNKWLQLFIFIVCIASIFGIFRFIQFVTKKPTFNLTVVGRSTIIETVNETGTIRTSSSTPVYSSTSGIVLAVHKQNGDEIHAGDVLANIKSTATDEEKIAKKAAYLAAKADLENAQAVQYSLQASMFDSWDTYKNLAENDMYETGEGVPRNDMRSLPEFQISQKEWLGKEAEYKTQQQVVNAKKAALQSATIAYQSTLDATVVSPIGGVIANISVSTGSSVLVNTGSITEIPLLIIESNAPMEIEVPLSESEVAKVHVGNTAVIKPKAFQGVLIEGIITRVDTVGRLVSGVIRYNAYATFDPKDITIRRGMNVDVEIQTNKAEQVVSVPNSAIKPYQGKKAVRIPNSRSDMGYQFVPVEIGIRGKERTQILSGIEEGKQVILSLTNEQSKRKGLFGN